MPLASWLFLKGSESIWVERPHVRSMLVAGPGALREHHDFADESTLQAYQVALAEHLTASGWLLWDFDRDRRELAERRRLPRNTPERRRGATRA